MGGSRSEDVASLSMLLLRHFPIPWLRWRPPAPSLSLSTKLLLLLLLLLLQLLLRHFPLPTVLCSFLWPEEEPGRDSARRCIDELAVLPDWARVLPAHVPQNSTQSANPTAVTSSTQEGGSLVVRPATAWSFAASQSCSALAKASSPPSSLSSSDLSLVRAMALTTADTHLAVLNLLMGLFTVRDFSPPSACE